jgi:hypothetical protein
MTTFLGMSLRDYEITPSDQIDLANLNLATLKATDGKWYIYPAPDQAKTSFHLYGSDYYHAINQLKRVKDHIYAAYNNDFGLHDLDL